MGFKVEELIRRLGEVGERPSFVIMPDFFVDHFLHYGGALQRFIDDVTNVARRGGGCRPFTKQTIMRGGNGANMGAALGMLGARVSLIVRTSPLGLSLLKHFFDGLDVDLSRVKTDGRLATTIAIELEYDGRLVNVMVNDSGSVVDFGFESLSEDDLRLIKEADYVCVVNWGQNFKGTELASMVFDFVKKEGVGKTFFDSSDPAPRRSEVPELVERVLLAGNLDIISVNENEAVWYASYFDKSFEARRGHERLDVLALEAAKTLSERVETRIDLHTINYSASFEGGVAYMAPTFDVEVQRATGAGDAWNAGDTYGDSLGLSPELRLILANAAAGDYISNKTGKHPSRGDLIKFLNSARLKKLPF